MQTARSCVSSQLPGSRSVVSVSAAILGDSRNSPSSFEPLVLPFNQITIVPNYKIINEEKKVLWGRVVKCNVMLFFNEELSYCFDDRMKALVYYR